MEESKLLMKFYKHLNDEYEPTEDEFYDFIYTEFSCCICRSSCSAPCWRSDDGDVICISCQTAHFNNENLCSDGTLLVPIKHGLLPCKFACSFTGTIEENIRHEKECDFKKALEEWKELLNRKDEKCTKEEEEVQNSSRNVERQPQMMIDENNNVAMN
ncbi:hypothetical protein WA026_008196 [Henosepilachna vigintioctopunctata]|uniref:Uncharacterized protein n=1 Tax=Henosepilachna vigintioctopunctata TaxID=420089 RepID=A0AAW1TJW8_9CUCU